MLKYIYRGNSIRRLFSSKPPVGPSSGNNLPDNKKIQSDILNKPSAAPATIDPTLKSLFKAPKIQYDPTTLSSSKSYSYKAPKSPNQLYKDEISKRSKGKSKFQKLLPSLLISFGACWGIFAYQYMTHDMNPNVDTDSALLRVDKFLPWIISYKYQIDKDHFLIELTRRNRAEKLIHNQQLFNGDKIWSVEIMQPDINITRNFTPLPMYIAGIDPYNETPHLRLVSELEHEGKFILIIKRYNNGEFSKWITNLNLLDEVNLRGPIVEFKSPFHPLNKYDERPQMANKMDNIKPDPIYPENLPKPENLTFLGAGTGILPLFQMIYSKNPPKGFIDVWYSLHEESELLPQLKTLNFFVEQCGRVKFHYLIGSQGRRITFDDLTQPTLPNFTGASDLRISEEIFKEKLKKEKKQEILNQLQGGTQEGNISSTKTNNTSANISSAKIIIEPMEGVDTIPLVDERIKPETAYQQHTLSRLLNIYNKTPQQSTPATSLTLVCGPESYITFLTGKPNRNNLTGEDTAPIAGALKEKGWDQSNVIRLQ